jgi:DNA-binding response OmpR family regulator
MESRLLVVDDELFVRELLAEYFTKLGYHVRTTGSAAEALEAVRTEDFNAALIDLRMPGVKGNELISGVREVNDDLSIIIMTGYPTVDTAVGALRAGASDYIVKPFRLKELDVVVGRAVAAQQHRYEIKQLRERVAELETRVAKLRKHENREAVDAGHRRFTIIEKGVEGDTFELDQPVITGGTRHRLRESALQDQFSDERFSPRRDFTANAVSLMDETS